jgi:hypothetical protein
MLDCLTFFTVFHKWWCVAGWPTGPQTVILRPLTAGTWAELDKR